MRGEIGTVVLGVWLGCFTVAAAQLPPEIMVDQYLLQTERLMAQKDHKGAFEVIKKIADLQKEHDLTLPDEFHFKYAKVAFSVGSIHAAKESVNKYLTVAGREGEYYGEALELSLEIGEVGAERTPCAGEPKGSECWMELANQPKSYVWNSSYQPYKTVTWTGAYLGNLAHGRGTLKWVVDIDPKPRDASPSQAVEPKCAGQPKGTACWIALENQPECYVWNPNPHSDETVTWTGECSGGRAQGEGTRKWVWEGGEKTSQEKGLLKDGKPHGQWVWRTSEEKKGEAFYVYGEYVGPTADAEDVMEGRIVKGKMQGDWVERWGDGGVEEGPYVEGKRHGDWVMRDADGDVSEGAYVDGKRQGNWVARYASGVVAEGPYVEGKRHGDWVERISNVIRRTGAYAEGKQHGHWVWREESGDVWREGTYVYGKRHGNWVERFSDGNIRFKGAYANGKKHGDWVETGDYAKYEGAYVEGKKHGRWTSIDRRKRFEGKIASIVNYKDGKYHGDFVRYHFYSRDSIGEKGLYVDGKKHGPWIETDERIPGTSKFDFWNNASGSYVDGKREGNWILSRVNGDVSKGPFVGGQPYGVWRQEDEDGTIKGIYFEDGKEQNSWFYRDEEGTTYDGPVVAGKKHGKWIIRTANGRLLGKETYVEGKKHGFWNEFYFETEDHYLYIEGSYEDGHRQGRWNIYRGRDRNKKVRGGGLYVNGSKTGPWVEYKDYDGSKTKYNYVGD